MYMCMYIHSYVCGVVCSLVTCVSCRNYGPTIRVQRIAESKGCSQVLWLLGDDHQVCTCSCCGGSILEVLVPIYLIPLQLTEVGTMNIFVHWINEDGGKV